MNRNPRRCTVWMYRGASDESPRALRKSRMQLARAESLTIAFRQAAASSSSFVMSRSRCSTRCRSTANARGVSSSRRAPHHAHSFSASMRTAGGSSERVRLMPHPDDPYDTVRRPQGTARSSPHLGPGGKSRRRLTGRSEHLSTEPGSDLSRRGLRAFPIEKKAPPASVCSPAPTTLIRDHRPADWQHGRRRHQCRGAGTRDTLSRPRGRPAAFEIGYRAPSVMIDLIRWQAGQSSDLHQSRRMHAGGCRPVRRHVGRHIP
jgi:hypothetical protein